MRWNPNRPPALPTLPARGGLPGVAASAPFTTLGPSADCLDFFPPPLNDWKALRRDLIDGRVDVVAAPSLRGRAGASAPSEGERLIPAAVGAAKGPEADRGECTPLRTGRRDGGGGEAGICKVVRDQLQLAGQPLQSDRRAESLAVSCSLRWSALRPVVMVLLSCDDSLPKTREAARRKRDVEALGSGA